MIEKCDRRRSENCGREREKNGRRGKIALKKEENVGTGQGLIQGQCNANGGGEPLGITEPGSPRAVGRLLVAQDCAYIREGMPADMGALGTKRVGSTSIGLITPYEYFHLAQNLHSC